jgi:DNA-binding MarR family transcriptional regulator
MNEMRVGLELRSLNNLIRRYFEFSSHKNEIQTITGNNGWIIGYLANQTGQDVFQKDIEEHFTITRSTTSRVLSLMEQKGLIERQSVTHDARLKKIVLTEKAWKVRKMMKEDALKMESTLLQGFTEEETEKLLTYLRKMKDNISNIQEEP